MIQARGPVFGPLTSGIILTSPDPAAPEGRLLGREVTVPGAEVVLQLDRIASRRRDHGLQPDGAGARDVGAEISPKEPQVYAVPFRTSQPLMRAEVLALTWYMSVAPKRLGPSAVCAPSVAALLLAATDHPAIDYRLALFRRAAHPARSAPGAWDRRPRDGMCRGG